MASQYSEAARNAMLNAVTTLLGAGAKIRFYTGTRPANVDTALSGNVVLAECVMSTPAFAAAAVGAILAQPISSDVSADATGTCTWASVLTNGNVRVQDMNVAVGGTDLDVNTVDFIAGALVTIAPFSLALPA